MTAHFSTLTHDPKFQLFFTKLTPYFWQNLMFLLWVSIAEKDQPKASIL